MNYKQIEEYILNIPKFRKEGSIEETRKFYEFLGKPGKNSTIIHVAGTNGKGSTCAYMNSVLTEAGKRTGMFTSPHLVSVRERMRVNNSLISEQDFADAFRKLTEYTENYNKRNKEDLKGRIANNQREVLSRKDYFPTFYEFLFFMAMLYFEEQKADSIILETGLGGRLDATNVIEAPKVTVITEIGMDHMEYLGNTFEKIAEEKAGIIKPGSVVVYSRNRQESAMVIERKAAETGVLCKSVEKLEKQHYRFVDKKIDFSFFSRYYDYIPIRLNTCAVYQVENARLALSALEEAGIEISKEAMQKGIENSKWEGRMEEIFPNVYLDGAHNEDGIDAFILSVKEDRCRGCRWLLFSAVADKEYCLMRDKLIESDLFEYIYATPLKTTRSIERKELERLFAENSIYANDNLENMDRGHKVRISDSACEGLEEILSGKEDEDFVYVTGSLYLVGEIKGAFER